MVMRKQPEGRRDGIYIAGQDTAVMFARDELAAYLRKMTGRNPEPAERPEKAGFILGTFADLAGMLGVEKQNSRWHDALFLKSLDGRLVISGPNGRSVLFSVYAYLEELGCRWLYPGPEGEQVPAGIGLRTDGFDRCETPGCRFRGLMAYPLFFEEGRDVIDWMAKRRMNHYYQEGFPADHPCRQAGEGVSEEEKKRRAGVRELVLVEARRRGLIIERFGHGWLDGMLEMYAREKRISFQEAEEALRARGVSGKANQRQFCLSHPDVRRLLVRHICEYVEHRKDEQDIIGIDMGDACDDVCRCERCKARHFSAWYLDVIRQVAERLRQTAPGSIVEYTCYFNTLGAPRERLLDGLDNLVMEFAPLGRCYRHTLRDPACRHARWKPDFRNHHTVEFDKCLKPRNADFMQAYREWLKDVRSPRFLVDYFNWTIRKPECHFQAYLPDTLAEDVRGYAAEKLDGCVVCQPCRDAFPTNLVNETFARLLWDKSGDVRTVRAAYLKDLFGPWAQAVEQHMDAMRAAFLKLTPDEDVYVQQSTAVVVQVTGALDRIRDRFEAAFPASAFSGPYAARLVRLKVDLLYYHMLFHIQLACRNKPGEQPPACVEAAQVYIRAHKDEIDVVTAADTLTLSADQIRRQAKLIKEAKFGWW